MKACQNRILCESIVYVHMHSKFAYLSTYKCMYKCSIEKMRGDNWIKIWDIGMVTKAWRQDSIKFVHTAV